jgi:hypothetical protein
MKTFIISVIGITILYLLARQYFAYKAKQDDRRAKQKQEEDERDIERIIGGRPIHEVYAELDAKELQDLTPNENQVLLAITLSYEHNQGHSDNVKAGDA